MNTTKLQKKTRTSRTKRYQKQRVKKVLIRIIATLILVCVAFIGGMKCSNVFANDYISHKEKAVVTSQNIVKAEMHTDGEVKKCYTTVQVNAGDTLWSIAKTYMDHHYDSVQQYIAEVKNINGLKDDRIHESGYLTIAYFEYL